MSNTINPSIRTDILKTNVINTNKTNATDQDDLATGEKKSLTEPVDKLDIGSKPETKGTYSKPAAAKLDTAGIEELQKKADEALRPLREMVEKLLKDQGKAAKKAEKASNDTSSDKMVTITPEMRAEAQKQISDGGEYSVENTSTRIVEYAKSLAGDDMTKFAELKDSIEKGFAEAKKAFGGSLPEISQQTYDMTMKKLDEWANGTGA